MSEEKEVSLQTFPCNDCVLSYGLKNNKICSRGSQEFPQTNACQKPLEWKEDFETKNREILRRIEEGYSGIFTEMKIEQFIRKEILGDKK